MLNGRLTAKNLKKIVKSDVILEGAVSDHLRAIREGIKSQAKVFRSKLVYKLPYNFSVVGMNLVDSQSILYFKIMKQLEDDGFTVKLKCESDDDNFTNNYLIVTWVLSDTSGNIDEIKRYIQDHMV